MKNFFAKILITLAVFCILHNFQTSINSGVKTMIIEEFGDLSQENDDKNQEKQDIELALLTSDFYVIKLPNQDYINKRTSYSDLDPSINTPPPNFYS